ncbi:PREDICTED: uncharacterized protein LOC104812183 [Tarenaya hassleriana]|uniref:uncharacterized protein LOC104812183 n=1 Tax=Tarenaya hassleriana TaxID=28532 RepID=UPI00053C354C|nr:PREDICTED: uncharacterized protein LOC104812183 [Tarenaya hassleriana]
MADPSSVDAILEFLRRNRFTKAEEALRGELNNSFLQKLTLEERDSGKGSDEKATSNDFQRSGSRNSEVFKELVVKEVDCGTGRNGSEVKWRNGVSSDKSSKKEVTGSSERSFTLSKSLGDTALDMHSCKPTSGNGPSEAYQNDIGTGNGSSVDAFVWEQTRHGKLGDVDKLVLETGEDIVFFGDKRTSWSGSTSKANSGTKANEINDLEQIAENISKRDGYMGDSRLGGGELTEASLENWKVLAQSRRGLVTVSEKREGKKKSDTSDIRAAIKEQVDEVGRALFFGKSSSYDEKSVSSLGFPLMYGNPKEEFPRLPPVKLKSEDKPLNLYCEETFEHDGSGVKLINNEEALLIGSYLDVPIGQEINSSGGKRSAGGNWLSVSQGIAEDASDLVSGFATIGDGLSESVDYANEYWDSDEYEDDDDVGYIRQPIEDETWFLAHEIDYPSDHEKGTTHGSPDAEGRGANEDDQSYAEEDSYFSGEQYLQAKVQQPLDVSDNSLALTVSKMYPASNNDDLIAQYDGQLMDEEELNSMCSEPVWQGFVSQRNERVMLGDRKVLNAGKSHLDGDQQDSVRSIGVGISTEVADFRSEVADFRSEVRESLVGGSSVGEYSNDHDGVVSGFKHFQSETDKKHTDGLNRDHPKASTKDVRNYVVNNIDTGGSLHAKNQTDESFSFISSKRDGQLMHKESSKSLQPGNCKEVMRAENAECLNASTGTDDMIATWRRKSSDSSSSRSSRNENNATSIRSENSSPSSLSNYAHAGKEDDRNAISAREEDHGASLDDEEAAAVKEQLAQIKAQEEFETFNLKIVHRKNRTGFEEDKNFHVVLNSVIAGRYHVTEYLGSAAFSKAIQAHDLQTGMDVCIKIIKNNKDFFDQSLDEIKLLKYVNKHDPGDKYHILRLYDYFYYREHLLIVCELLKANLYEFHKFNRESGGEVYFTMPRLQSITIQCLEALQFLHGLGLIHCDLKPENILVKSYSRCEVKVIDLGSSCFETDHLCSYVQSRSYRAPEVILGLPYDKKIDIWSLGCILAELCTGNVLFQNDSPATLLARVVGIIGRIDQEMLAKGRDTYKYFTKYHMLYERNQETNRVECLIPKRTSLRHRLPMGDQGFIDFVAHLLEINPKKRPSASDALKHPWLSYPYEPIST